MILRWWRAYQRSIDIKILWPVVAANSNEQLVRRAWEAHMDTDPAWRNLRWQKKQKILERLMEKRNAGAK